MKKNLIKYSSAITVGLIIAYSVAQNKGVFTAVEPKERAMYVSDSFFVPAVLLLGIGAIVWVSTTGFFDIFGYAVKSVFNRFIRPGKNDSNGTYYDYVMSKEEHRGQAQPFLVFTGLVFLVVSVIAYIVYTQI